MDQQYRDAKYIAVQRAKEENRARARRMAMEQGFIEFVIKRHGFVNARKIYPRLLISTGSTQAARRVSV